MKVYNIRGARKSTGKENIDPNQMSLPLGGLIGKGDNESKAKH